MWDFHPPVSSSLVFELKYCPLQEKRYELCHQVLSEPELTAPDVALVMWTFLRDGHPELAASTAQRLIREYAEDSAAWANYGEYLAKLGHPKRAVLAFERAGRLAGTSSIGRAQLGYCLYGAGRTDEACEQLYLAHLLDPADGEITEMFHQAAFAGNPRLGSATWPPSEMQFPEPP